MSGPAEDCHCATLRRAARHVSRLYDSALAPVGLSLNQYTVLFRLQLLGGRALQDLARHLAMDRSTLGHLLRPLQRRGLVLIALSDRDRRGRIVSLTSAGQDVVAKARPLWHDAQRRFIDAVGGPEARGVRDSLRRISGLRFALNARRSGNADG